MLNVILLKQCFVRRRLRSSLSEVGVMLTNVFVVRTGSLGLILGQRFILIEKLANCLQVDIHGATPKRQVLQCVGGGGESGG